MANDFKAQYQLIVLPQKARFLSYNNSGIIPKHKEGSRASEIVSRLKKNGALPPQG